MLLTIELRVLPPEEPEGALPPGRPARTPSGGRVDLFEVLFVNTIDRDVTLCVSRDVSATRPGGAASWAGSGQTADSEERI
jgi:hypothetical protein